MKNKLIVGIIVFFVILFGYCITTEAAILVSNKQVNSEEQFSINVTSDIALISYTVTANADSAISLVNSSGGAGAGTKKISNALTTGTTTELATFTFKAPKVEKDTQYTITFSGTGMGKEDYSKAPNDTKTATITVKAPVAQTTQQNPTTNKTEPQPQETKVEEKPNFANANKTMYASKGINLRASWSTSSKATPIEKGTELAVTATSNNKVNGYIWYKVTYNGQTLYVASNLLTSTKPEEEPVEEPEEVVTAEEPEEEPIDENESENVEATSGLKSLEIEGLSITPAFSPDVYEYRVIVKKEISELAINAITAIEDSTITIAGNDNIKEGENLITIVVYNAKKEVEATYQITVNKSTIDLTDTDEMLSLGTKEAKRNVMIFAIVFSVAIIGLIIVMVLKNKKQQENDEYETDIEQEAKFTEREQTVENPTENTKNETIKQEETQEKPVQEEIRETRREKRKGKHF